MGIKDRLKNEKGLTLIEVLASVAILLIVLGIGMAALMQSSVLTSKVQGESQDRQDMQVGLLELTNAVQSATDIKKGKDDYNFEIIDSENRTIKYWLVDGQLNSDSKDGQTQVEGIQKMTIQDGKGITLQIEDLEEPVVLATRGGVITTNLVDETELYSDIICLRPDQVNTSIGEKPKDFSGYPQFKEIAESIHPWSGDSIQCDTRTGTLQIRAHVKVLLDNGGIRIKTNKLILDQFATLDVKNGGVLIPSGNVDLGQESNLIGHGLSIGGNLISTNIKTTVYSERDIKVFGELTANMDSNYTSKGNFYIKGPIKSSNINVNITSHKDLFINDNATLNFKGKLTSFKTMYINGTVKNVNNETILSSGENLIINGNLIIEYKSELHSQKSIYINGTIENKNVNTIISSKEDIVVFGDVKNNFESKLTSNGSIYIKGDLINSANEPKLKSNKDIVIYGKTTNNQKSEFISGNSIYIGKSLQLGRENMLDVTNNLYIQEGVTLSVTSKILVKNKSYINGAIALPTSRTDGENAFFETIGLLTYTAITGVEVKNSGFKVLVTGSRKPVEHIDNSTVMPYLPNLPPTPSVPK